MSVFYLFIKLFILVLFYTTRSTEAELAVSETNSADNLGSLFAELFRIQYQRFLGER
jgi:hypothetical protein